MRIRTLLMLATVLLIPGATPNWMLPDASNATSSAWNALSISPGQTSVPRLNHWRATLARIGTPGSSARGTLLVLGTSQSAGGQAGSGGPTNYNGAYPNAWPAVLATRLSEFVPTTDNSLFSDQNVVSKGVTYELYDPRCGPLPAGWTWGSSTQSIGGVALQYNNSGVNPFPFAPANVFDTIKFYYVQKAGQGSFTVNIDGGASLGTVNTATGNRQIGTAQFSVARGIHTINIVPSNTGQLVFMGIKTYDSTIPGVDMIRGARAGGSTANYTGASSPFSALNTIAALAPDLTLVFLVSNDLVTNVPIATFTANLQTIITQAQQSGDVVIGTESPVQAVTSPYATQQLYVNAVRALAISNNIPLVSIFDRWGGTYENLNNFYQNGIPTLQFAGTGYTPSQTSAIFTVQGGTCPIPIQVLADTNGSGAVSSVDGLYRAGSCTTFPTSPATISGLGGSNATVNITAAQLMAYGDPLHPGKPGYRDWAQANVDVLRWP